MNPYIYLSFAYAFSEFTLMLSKKSKDESVRIRSDRGSLIFLWFMITIGFFAGFTLSKPISNLQLTLGLPLIIGGMVVRWIAILQLGSSFTVDVAINEESRLKTDGIFERIRHPSYSGLLLVIVGFASTMGSIYSFFVLVIPVFVALIYRIRVEEKLLRKAFGDSYIKYSRNTWKLIPGIF
jgi:protein-S-isoprenylcysteine O-methyltransferase Ste14